MSNLPNRKVLITGGTGFIGNHCLPLLSSQTSEVHVVSHRKDKISENNIHYHHANLLNEREMQVLIADIQPTHLLHLAWYAVPGRCWQSLENFRWVEASLILLRAFVEHGGQRIVMAGTCAEYAWHYGFCSEQFTPLLPSTTYGICKHAMQTMLHAFSREQGVSSAWGRIFFLYGPHEHPSRLVSSVILSILRGLPANCSHGNQIRDFLYVRDVADALVTLLLSEVEGTINIGSGQPIVLKDIIYKIADMLQCRECVRLGSIETPENDPPLLVADTRRLSRELNWQPKHSLEQGLEQTISWWQDMERQGIAPV